MNLTNTSKSEEFCMGQRNTEDFFLFLMSNSLIKTISLISSTITVVLILMLLCGIILYHKNGPDQRRTFLTRIVLSICMGIIEINFVILLTEIVWDCV